MSAARPRQDLETALLRLVEAALAGAPANARVPPTEQQRLARLLAAGLRVLVRAALREALARALAARPEAGVRVRTATHDRVRLELTGARRARAASAPDAPA